LIVELMMLSAMEQHLCGVELLVAKRQTAAVINRELICLEALDGVKAGPSTCDE
jgi:hypothetical protein